MNIELKRLPDSNDLKYPIVYKVLTPIYHPAVHPKTNNVIGKTPEDVFKQLQDLDYACKDAYNIDAAVDWKKNREHFYAKNKQLH